jgi:probable HAF family extracellular repeat protein
LGVVILVATFITLILATEGHTATANFTLTDLGIFIPTAINNNGQVAGWHFTADFEQHAVLYKEGTLTDLGTLAAGGPYAKLSIAYAINNRGQVVGFSSTTNGCFCHAFLWENGAMIDLTPLSEYPTLANGKGTAGEDINNKGQIVGLAFIDGVASGPVLWDNGEIIPLGTLGGELGDAARINNHGEIAGSSDLADGTYHAFLYSDGSMMDLGTLGGRNSSAYGLNDRGQVVGYSTTTNENTTHAFLYTDGIMVDLSLLTGAVGPAYAPDINSRGQVIVIDTSGRSFLYDKGIVTNLTELVYKQFGWVGFSAAAINDAGSIVGYACGSVSGDQRCHGILLSPVGPPVS